MNVIVKKFIGSGLCGLVLLLSGCVSVQQAQKMDSAEKQELVKNHWPQQCEALRDILKFDRTKYLVYSKAPAFSNAGKYWKLRWEGLDIAVPAVAYQQVLALPDVREGHINLILNGPGNLVVSLQYVQDFLPLEEIFSTFSMISGENLDSEVGKAFTDALFSSPLSTTELIDLGYRHTPDDISCDENRWQEEIMMTVGLFTKTSEMNRNVEVYPLSKTAGGWQIRSNENALAVWQTFVPYRNPNSVLSVSYYVPDRGPYHDAGLAVDVSAISYAGNPPQWLVNLQSVLNEASIFNLQQLKQSLEEGGFDATSTNSVDSLMQTMFSQ